MHKDTTVYTTPEERIEIKSRRVKFDDVLDPEPRCSEYHHVMLDYGEGVPRNHKDTTVYTKLEENIAIKSRKVRFDDILDIPGPQVKEIHPIKLDYGKGFSRTREEWRALNIPVFTEFRPIVKWPRKAMFVLDVPVKSSEIHPFKLHFGHNHSLVHLIPAQNTDEHTHSQGFQLELKWPRKVMFVLDIEVQRSEIHPFKLHFGHNHASVHPINVLHYIQEHGASLVKFQFIESDSELMSVPVAGKKPHFSILRNRETQSQKTKRTKKSKKKCLVNLHKASLTLGLFQSQKVLHESIVVASHLYWSLKYTDFEDEDEHGEEEILTALDYVSNIPYWDELSPFSFAPNRKFLTSGCPTFHRLRKIPEFDFPMSLRSSTDQTGSDDRVQDEEEGSSVPFDVDATTSASTDNETQLNVVRESKKLAIEPHAHLLQSLFPHLETAATHKKPSDTQHKVVLYMPDFGLEEDDIMRYLPRICKVQWMYKNVRVTDLQHSSSGTTCTLTFPSGKSANRFKHHVDNLKQNSGCYIEMYNQVDNQAVRQVLKERLDAVVRENLDALAVHQKKLRDIDEKLKKTQGKKTNLAEMNHVLEERQALLQKQQELKNQEQEFLSYTNIFQNQFMKIPLMKNWKAKASVLEQRNQIEKERLCAALPMYAKRTEIVKMIAENQVSILLGETGSGKSTQVTQYLYEAGLTGQKKIVCTQPRKVAATSLAKRVAEEMHSELGGVVGFKVGMQRELSRETCIFYVTDHMLLKECLDDPLLTKYSCVIIDEAHERSLNTDLLLGMIKKALVYRPELRVVITSATIDPSVFVSYFNGCPVLKVSGRVFPVEVFYSDEPADPDSNFVHRAVEQALDVALCKEPGDTLVFLTTPLETEKACEMMIKRWPNNKKQLLCMALHGKTQRADQQKVFNQTPQGQRKVVFATNSAETSVTIPGIKVVIDTGLAKEKMYDPAKNMSSLKVCKISQSSADQRKGRAGRTEKGKCYRLYTEEDYDTMDSTSKPEILRVHLGMALLTLLSFNIEDPLSFDFVEMPPRIALEKAMNVLVYLGAVGKDGKLTPLGKKLAALSLEPRMGKLVLNGIDQGIGFECLLVASFSTMGGNMFYRGGSEKKKQQADKLKVRFCNLRGDIHTMLDVYKEWNQQPEKVKNNWCMENSINSKSLRMARESVKEIQATLTHGLRIKVHQKFHSNRYEMEALLETVIAESYAMNLCVFAGHESLGYMMVTDLDTLVHVHPSSALKPLAKSPCYMAFENTLTTSRAFVINITCVSDETIETICQQGNLEIDLDEVKKRVVILAKIDTVGKSTITKICGPRHSTRLMLEKDLQVYFNTEKLTLETKADVGTVTVFALPDMLKECFELVKKMVVQEQECLYQEEIERPLEEGCAIRVIIGHGGKTKHLLFANEFRSLFIRSVPEQYSKEQLIESFREVAVVTDYEDRFGLRVVFDRPEAAEEVLQLLDKGREEDLVLPGITAKPDLTGAKGLSPPPLQNVSLKLTWCRRPNKGIAFVKFSSQNPNLAKRAMESMSHVTIDGHLCPIKVSNKTPHELFIRNVPKMVANHDIANMVKESIKEQTLYQPKDVVVPNDKPFETTQSDCAQFKKIIETRIKQEAPEVTGVEVSMRPPTEKAVQYVAFVNLKNSIHADSLFTALIDMTILGITTRVNMTLKTFIVVRQEILPYVRDEVDNVVFELEGGIEGLNCRGELMRRGPADYRIDISARSAADLAKARAQIAKCIEGERIDIEKAQHLQYFKYTQKGQQFMKRVQQQCHVHMTVDQYLSFIVLRGGNHDIRKATTQIKERIILLHKSDTKTYNLKELYPPGLTKRLMGIYGLDLEDLVRASNVEMVELQLRNHLLTAHGTLESITKIEQLIKNQAMALAGKTPKDTDKTALLDCPVCFCEVESHDMYRLEYCAHAYCGSCMKGLVEHGIKDRRFPIQCATENCGKDIVMKDIFALVGTSMDRLSPFIKSSLDCYVKTKEGEALKYCITPDCGMVYPTDRANMEVCGLCQVKICTWCDSEYHPGITCHLNKMMKDRLQGRSFDEYSKETWLAEDTKNRALCPKCKCGIEKNGGCNRVQCQQCLIHICWNCKAAFNERNEAYAHIGSECGQLFDY